MSKRKIKLDNGEIIEETGNVVFFVEAAGVRVQEDLGNDKWFEWIYPWHRIKVITETNRDD